MRIQQPNRAKDTMDHRDRLILALSALLGAEREARQACESAIAAGALSQDLLRAIGSDPIPVTQDDIVLAEEFSSPYFRSPRHMTS
jgi:hypothetical protein